MDNVGENLIMCDELNHELDTGRRLAKELIEHAKRMGAKECGILVDGYILSVRVKRLEILSGQKPKNKWMIEERH